MQPGFLRRLTGSDRGAVAVLFGLTVTVLVGFAGLGAEVALWYIAKRTAQAASDTAAYSATVAYRAGESIDFPDTARAIAAHYGFRDKEGGVSVAVNRPPHAGPRTNDPNAIEVIISTPQAPLFSKLFVAAPSISARSVALLAVPGGSIQVVE